MDYFNVLIEDSFGDIIHKLSHVFYKPNNSRIINLNEPTRLIIVLHKKGYDMNVLTKAVRYNYLKLMGSSPKILEKYISQETDSEQKYISQETVSEQNTKIGGKQYAEIGQKSDNKINNKQIERRKYRQKQKEKRKLLNSKITDKKRMPSFMLTKVYQQFGLCPIQDHGII